MITLNRTRARRLLWSLALTTTALSAFALNGVAGAANVAATIQGFAFVPTPLSVAPGDTITWTNKDAQAHDITPKVAGSWKAADIAGNGATATTVAPSAAGTYDIICTIHPRMAGQLVVAPGAPGTGTGLASAAGGFDTTLLAGGLLLLTVAFVSGGAAVKLRK